MRINKLRRSAAVMAVALLLILLVVPGAAAAPKKVMRVAFPQAEGYTMTAPDGQRYGLVVDFLNEIAKYTGWEYEYIDTDGETMLDCFFEGAYDLMGGSYYAEGFEQYFAYPEYNCGYSKLVLLARKDDESIKYYDLNTLNGKTIGVYERSTENIRRLQAYLNINALDCTLKYYSYDDLSITGNLKRFLESGDVDLLMGNSVDAGGDFYIAAMFDSQPHYIVARPEDQETVDALNMALERIYEADPNFAQKEYTAHFATVGSGYAMLNEEEKAYVAEQQTVTVAVPRTWHPMYCLDDSDSHNGFIPDVLQAAADFSGLTFRYLVCDNYVDTLEKVQTGEADLLGFFVGTEEEAMDRGLALTLPYVELDSILVRNKESSYPAEGLTGAVLSGRKMPADIVVDEVKYYPGVLEALEDVNRGKVDFFYGISANLERTIQQGNFTNLVQVNLVNNNIDIGFALPKPAPTALLTILNKTINNLSDEQKTAISSRNTVSIGTNQFTLASIVNANPALAISVVAVFLLLVLIAVLLVSRSRVHAAVMRSELEKAEADSRAKSAFLSRMSHEIRTPMNAIVGLTDLTEMTAGLPEKARNNLIKIKASARYLLNLINDILDMSRIESGKMEIAAEPFSMSAMLGEIESMMTAEAGNRGLRFRLEKELQDDALIGDGIRLRQILLNLLSNAFKFTPAGGTVRISASEIAATEKDASFLFCVEDTGMGIAEEDQQRIFRSFEQVGSNITKSQGTGLGLAISSHIAHLMGGELTLQQSEPGTGSTFAFTVTLPKGQPGTEPPVKHVKIGEHMLRDMHVLLAEDNDLNAEIAIELLQMQGAVVVRAANGKLALQQFEDNVPGTFDVILMDILMPEMDGMEATRAIRALPRADAAVIPIIAMTANAFRSDEEAAVAAGMTGFIPKPIDVNHLYEELCRALEAAENS